MSQWFMKLSAMCNYVDYVIYVVNKNYLMISHFNLQKQFTSF
jgi:hypothetical protein